MSLDVLNPSILKSHKPKGGFCVIKADYVDGVRYVYTDFDFGLVTGDWTQLIDVIKRKSATTNYNGDIIISGGANSSNLPEEQTWSYDIGTNSLTSVYFDDYDRHSHMIYYQPSTDRFYTFGGYGDSGGGTYGVTNRVSWAPASVLTGGSSYYWDTSAVTQLPATPAGQIQAGYSVRLCHSGGYYNGKIFMYGGWRDTNVFNDSYRYYNMVVYDIDSSQPHSATIEAYNTSFTPNVATIDTDNGRLYVPSYDGGDTSMVIRWCDISGTSPTYAWTEVTTDGIKPERRRYHSLEYYDGNLIMFGGRSLSNTLLSDCWIYNIENNQWYDIVMTGGKPGAEFATSIVVNDKLYLFGGDNISSNNPLPDAYSYDLLDGMNVMAIRIARGLE